MDEGREVRCVIHREIMMDGVKSLDWQDMTADDQGSAHTSLPLRRLDSNLTAVGATWKCKWSGDLTQFSILEGALW